MRIIKFRAWDKKIKKMINDIYIRNFINLFFEETKDYKVMQFTGLKDKNGKEIYEGDIVKEYPSKLISKIRIERCTGIVCNNAYDDSYIPLFEFGNSENWCEYLEVIGNIYENPELLEDKK